MQSRASVLQTLLQLPVTLYQPTAVFRIKVPEIWRHNFFIQQFTIRSCLLGAGSENEFEGGDSDTSWSDFDSREKTVNSKNCLRSSIFLPISEISERLLTER